MAAKHSTPKPATRPTAGRQTEHSTPKLTTGRQTSIRMDPDLDERITRHVAERSAIAGLPLDRGEVMRALIREGLDAFEAKHRKAKAK